MAQSGPSYSFDDKARIPGTEGRSGGYSDARRTAGQRKEAIRQGAASSSSSSAAPTKSLTDQASLTQDYNKVAKAVKKGIGREFDIEKDTIPLICTFGISGLAGFGEYLAARWSYAKKKEQGLAGFELEY